MKSISVQSLSQLMKTGADIVLIDVREPAEHAAFNIGGRLLPLAEVGQAIATIEREKPVVVYCQRGVRSAIAIQKLQQKLPFNNLVNLEGGMISWQRVFGDQQP